MLGGWMRKARKRARAGRAIRRQCRDLVARGGERSGQGSGGERFQEGAGGGQWSPGAGPLDIAVLGTKKKCLGPNYLGIGRDPGGRHWRQKEDSAVQLLRSGRAVYWSRSPLPSLGLEHLDIFWPDMGWD